MSLYHRSHSVRARDNGEEGASALEFALVAPVLLLLILGMIELAFMFQAQLAVTHAAREGARMAVVGTWDAGIVVSRAYPLQPVDGLAVGIADLGDSFRVTVTYPYHAQILPDVGAVTLNSDAIMRKE